jgi:hypothetical protein
MTILAEALKKLREALAEMGIHGVADAVNAARKV